MSHVEVAGAKTRPPLNGVDDREVTADCERG
jgi:hypothetical protein